MQFAEIFKGLCKEKGVTQLHALSHLGLYRTAPQNWKDDGRPNAETLQKIAEYFGVTTDYLLWLNEPHQKSNVVKLQESGSSFVSNDNSTISILGAKPEESQREDHLTDQEREVLRIFRLLDMRGKTAAMTYLYALEDGANKQTSD